MKRYWLFGGEYQRDAEGGMNDLQGRFDSIEEAQQYAKENGFEGALGWWHVYDSKHGEIVKDRNQ